MAASIIMPHIFHGFYITYVGLHIGEMTLAEFLSVLSIMAHLRLRIRRLLFTAIAFGIFIGVETALMIIFL